MSEYIIEWSGIGSRIVELMGSVHPCLIVKRLREERRREEIVRCHECRFVKTCDVHTQIRLEFGNESADNGFCAWSERKEND